VTAPVETHVNVWYRAERERTLTRKARSVREDVEPIFVSVQQAMVMLGLSRNQTYKLLDQRVIESRYFGRRRLVVLASLREFAEGLPTERP
jgi:hypothetical protein